MEKYFGVFFWRDWGKEQQARDVKRLFVTWSKFEVGTSRIQVGSFIISVKFLDVLILVHK